MDEECAPKILGGVAKTVLAIPARGPAEAENQSATPEPVAAPSCSNIFFTESPQKWILVIATPFREGQHVAQHPEDFRPIIDHMEKLHEAGYVHGDIRVYNAAVPNTKGGTLDRL